MRVNSDGIFVYSISGSVTDKEKDVSFFRRVSKLVYLSRSKKGHVFFLISNKPSENYNLKPLTLIINHIDFQQKYLIRHELSAVEYLKL